MTSSPNPIDSWYDALLERHLKRLSFQEVRRAVQALSRLYVQRREKLSEGAVFDGAGKRAAFALFYGPLHLLFLKEVLTELPLSAPLNGAVLDLGCGTGVGGAAVALATNSQPATTGVDQNAWALLEAQWTYNYFGLRSQTHRGDATGFVPTRKTGLTLAAYATNELPEKGRERLLANLLELSKKGSDVLIVEPIAKRQLPYWAEWTKVFESLGGDAQQWQVELDMPERLALLDKASGLNHRVMKGRTLWLPAQKKHL